MKRGIRFLSLILVFAMFLGITAIPVSAGSTTRYTMNVGDTKTLYTNAGGKALKGASWTTSDYQSVAIVSQNDFSCEIEVIGPSAASYVIVQCIYYYYDRVGSYTYVRSDYTDYYITVNSQQCTVWLDFNDGSGDRYSRTVTVGGTYGTLPYPERTGHNFDGWFTSSTGGSRISSSTKVTKSYDHTIYAHWTTRSYTVTFDPNGGTVEPSTKSVTYGSRYGALPVPVLEGRSFVGWFTQQEGGDPVTENTLVSTTGNRTLYAHYACETHTEEILHAVEATCTETGLTQGSRCSVCGLVTTPQQEVPALEHDWNAGHVTKWPTPDAAGVMTCACNRCGAKTTQAIPAAGETPFVLRLAGSHRWETSLKVADEMKANLGLEKFGSIIIASGNDFADALAGSYLSTVKNAPILLSWGKGGSYEYLDTDNIHYIKSNLVNGGTVYILGGTNAVPELYEEALKDYNVKRLGGANRFETNLLILQEAGVKEGDEILVCTSTNFADSLSASAVGKPIMLVFNELGQLYGPQPEFLAGLTNCTFTVIGGESAVSAGLAEAIGTYGAVARLAGSNRFETSVLVAQKYFENPQRAVLAYAWNYPDGLCGGSLAYSLKAPLILTMTGYEAQAASFIQQYGIRAGAVLGGSTLISDDSVRAIFAMETAN